ncbi:MAG: transglycosylase SLT domain-containing protein [Bacteroidales bacterium]|nr:MAG: transglycosylase SLT domain-containing protein [Bacteroidales bacterium]
MNSRKIITWILGVSFLMISGGNTNLQITDINTTGTTDDYSDNYYTDSIPRYPDIFYEYRIAELNKLTPVELDYNEVVKKYIENYTIKRRKEFAKIIGLADLYFPIFDNMLDKYDLPLELKYLTIVESSLNTNARSKSGAVGLWQFLLNTCKLFDLEVNSYIDERRDPYKSTDAACRYLKYLYSTYNEWQLALSSYNSGPGDIRKAIERSNGKTNYWEIRPYLSEQAQNYVPAFIAALYLMNHYKEHNIKPVPPRFSFNNIDTLYINYPVSFNQISDITGITTDELKFLNPVYRREFIPDLERPALLTLPKDKIELYIKNESRIIGKEENIDDYNSLVSNAGSTENKTRIIHVVQKGEFFHKIALKYSCTLENIKAWNNLTDNFLYPGQELIIWVEYK